jgi:hypothetical protein
LVAGWRLEGSKLVAFDRLDASEAARSETDLGERVSGDDVRGGAMAIAPREFGVNSWIVLSVILLNGVAFGVFLWMVLTGMFSKEHWVLRRVFLPRS